MRVLGLVLSPTHRAAYALTAKKTKTELAFVVSYHT